MPVVSSKRDQASKRCLFAGKNSLSAAGAKLIATRHGGKLPHMMSSECV